LRKEATPPQLRVGRQEVAVRKRFCTARDHSNSVPQNQSARGASARGSTTVAQPRDLSEQAANSRPKAVVFAHRPKPARLPFPELGLDESGKPRPAGTEAVGGIGMWVAPEPAL